MFLFNARVTLKSCLSSSGNTFYSKLKVSNIDILLYNILYNIPFTSPVRYEADLHALRYTPSEHTEYRQVTTWSAGHTKRQIHPGRGVRANFFDLYSFSRMGLFILLEEKKNQNNKTKPKPKQTNKQTEEIKQKPNSSDKILEKE